MSHAGVQPTDSPARNSWRSSPKARFISSCTRASSRKGSHRVSIAMTFLLSCCFGHGERKTAFRAVKRATGEPLRVIYTRGQTTRMARSQAPWANMEGQSERPATRRRPQARPPRTGPTGGHTFVGLTPRRTLLGWRWRPVYLSERQRTTHRHVLGKTGSGKTQGVLWPQVLQEARSFATSASSAANDARDRVGVKRGVRSSAWSPSFFICRIFFTGVSVLRRV